MSFGGDLSQRIGVEFQRTGGDVADDVIRQQERIAETGRLMHEAFQANALTGVQVVEIFARLAAEYNRLEKLKREYIAATMTEAAAEQAALQVALRGMNQRTAAAQDSAARRGDAARRAGQEEIAAFIAANNAGKDADNSALQAALRGMNQRSEAARRAAEDASQAGLRAGQAEIGGFLVREKADRDSRQRQAEAFKSSIITVQALEGAALDLRSRKIEESVNRDIESSKRWDDGIKKGIDQSKKVMQDWVQTIDTAFQRGEDAQRRYLDSTKKLPEIREEYDKLKAKIVEATAAQNAAQERAAASIEGHEKAQRRAAAAVEFYGVKSEEGVRATNNLSRVHAVATRDSEELTKANKELADIYARLNQLQGMAGSAAAVAGTKFQSAARLMMFAGQGIEDLQYGFSSFVNNIPLIANEFGRIIGLAPEVSMAFSAIASIGGVAINQVIRHWDSVQNAMSRVLNGEGSFKAFFTSIDAAADSFVDHFRVNFENKASGSVERLKAQLKDAEKVTEDLGSKSRLTAREMHAYEAAKDKVKELREELEKVNDLENLRKGRTKEEQEVGSGFEAAFVKHRGEAEGQLAGALQGHADAKGNVANPITLKTDTVENVARDLMVEAKRGDADARDEIVRIIKEKYGKGTAFTDDIEKESPEMVRAMKESEEEIKRIVKNLRAFDKETADLNAQAQEGQRETFLGIQKGDREDAEAAGKAVGAGVNLAAQRAARAARGERREDTKEEKEAHANATFLAGGSLDEEAGGYLARQEARRQQVNAMDPASRRQAIAEARRNRDPILTEEESRKKAEDEIFRQTRGARDRQGNPLNDGQRRAAAQAMVGNVQADLAREMIGLNQMNATALEKSLALVQKMQGEVNLLKMRTMRSDRQMNAMRFNEIPSFPQQ